jgi:hypothetical protein
LTVGEDVIAGEADNQLRARAKVSVRHGGGQASVQILQVEVELSLHAELIAEEAGGDSLCDGVGGLRPSIDVLVGEGGVVPALR